MSRVTWSVLVALAVLAGAPSGAAKVVNENVDDLPPGCDAIAGEQEITVRGGREHAAPFPGAVFAFDVRSFDVPACTRVTVTFVNEDSIRHQFMVHGTWPDGFFQLEVDGEGEATGSFIVGAEVKTRLVHCGLPQHQQKGMKAQILVAGGEGTLPNILGVSGIPPEDRDAMDAWERGEEADVEAAGATTHRAPFPGAVEVAAVALVGVALVLRRVSARDA